MGGGAAEMAVLGDANQGKRVAQRKCTGWNRVPRSGQHRRFRRNKKRWRSSKRNKSVVLALTQALINHPERTLKAVEIDKLISETLAREAMAAEQARRGARLTTYGHAARHRPTFVLYKHSIARA